MPPSADRSLSWWPIAGAAIIAAIGVVTVIVVGSGGQNRNGLKTDSDGALICPASYVQHALTGHEVPTAWVPVKYAGVDGTKSLVPASQDLDPLYLTICRYRANPKATRTVRLDLEGTTRIRRGLGPAVSSLSKLPSAPRPRQACTPTSDTYLMGFLLSGGEAVWIADPHNGCQNVTNGEFQTGSNIWSEIDSAYQTKRWG